MKFWGGKGRGNHGYWTWKLNGWHESGLEPKRMTWRFKEIAENAPKFLSRKKKKKRKIWKKDKESWKIEWGDPKYTYWNFFFFFFLESTLPNGKRKNLKDMNYPELTTNLSFQVGEANRVPSRKNKIKSMLRCYIRIFRNGKAKEIILK